MSVVPGLEQGLIVSNISIYFQYLFSKLEMAKVVDDLYEPVLSGACAVSRYIAGAGAGEVHRLMADARRGRSLAACLAARESVDEPL